MAQLRKDSGSQSQDTASWNFGSAISAFVLSKPRLRTGRVAELWCEEPDRALADTALVKELNDTARRTWTDLWMFAVPAQGRRDAAHRGWVQTCSTSCLQLQHTWSCFTECWKCKAPATAMPCSPSSPIFHWVFSWKARWSEVSCTYRKIQTQQSIPALMDWSCLGEISEQQRLYKPDFTLCQMDGSGKGAVKRNKTPKQRLKRSLDRRCSEWSFSESVWQHFTSADSTDFILFLVKTNSSKHRQFA